MPFTGAIGRRVYDYIFVPVIGPDGEVESIAGTTRDITERKESEERQRILTDELAHRSKNSLTVIQAMVSRTLNGTVSFDEARGTLVRRIQALSRSQSLLVDWGLEGARLSEIVRLEFEAFFERVDASGLEVMLNSRSAQTFALLLHELATNATKYGALSRPQGNVIINWSIEGTGAEARFRFQWQERGGPPVNPPKHRGFGSILIEKVVAQEFGTPMLEFAPEGVRYQIDTPLSAVAGGDNG